MRGFPRLALQRLHDDALDLGIGDLARHAWPRLIKQPVNAARDKAPAPLANRLHTHPLACRHRFIAQARGQPNTIRARDAKACAVVPRCA